MLQRCGRHLDLEPEHAAAAVAVADPDLAAHEVGEHACDGEADAAPAGERAAAAHERLEDAFQVVRRNAGAGVADVEAGHVAQVFDAQADAAALGEYMKAQGVLINASPIVRLVMHLDVSREQLAEVVAHWRAFLTQ